MSPVISVEQPSAAGESKNERRAMPWLPPAPLLEETAPELSPRQEGPATPRPPFLPLPALLAPRPCGPSISGAPAMVWGELSALIWGDIADLEVSTQRLTLKLRLAALMARRRGKSKS